MGAYPFDLDTSKLFIRNVSSRLELDAFLARLDAINSCAGCTVQVFHPGSIVSRLHVEGAYVNAVAAFRTKTNISKKIHVEMLLFAAMTRQISKAVGTVGVRSTGSMVLFANGGAAYSKAKVLLARDSDLIISRSESIAKSRRLGIGAGQDADALLLQRMVVSRLD